MGRKRHCQRCHTLQSQEKGRKESCLLKTPWTRPPSARHLQCPARTLSLLWSDVSAEWTPTRLTTALGVMTVNLWNEDILQLYCCCLFNFSQLQSLDQAQASCLHLMMSRRRLRGCPRFPFRSMCLQSAPERGFWDYWRPCCHRPKQYEKPSRVFKGWDVATVLICFIFLELGDWMISVSNVCMLNMMMTTS